MPSLAEQHISFAREVASTYARRLPTFDREDIEANALLGLVKAEASGKYDPSLGPFPRFARRYVEGAIKDGLKLSGLIGKNTLADIPSEKNDPAKSAEIADEARFIADHLPSEPYSRPRIGRLRGREIAKSEKITPGAASRRIGRARKILQHSYEHPCAN